MSRRKLIGGAAIGAGALWIAPSLIGLSTPAAASSVLPIVVGSDSRYDAPTTGTRSDTLSIAGGQVGDVLVGIAAYMNSGTINLPGTMTAWSSTAVSRSLFRGVRAVVFSEVLTAAGTVTRTITTSSDLATAGGLRFASVLIRRGAGGVTPITVQSVTVNSQTSGGSPATFPAAGTVPGDNHLTIRLGARRGIGSVVGPLTWDTGVATQEINTNGGSNSNDRGLVIISQPNATATQNIAYDGTGWPTVTFTAVVG